MRWLVIGERKLCPRIDVLEISKRNPCRLGRPPSQRAFFGRFLAGHTLYNAHAGVQRIVASDETPTGSFEKRSI